ncbi:calsyntenin-1-like [Daphnia pulex]|uniref:calsyntenin-1-like n=1 Tax=Daphnia pulex TaxID=6669 RepID=UPI001EDE283F|nr:calsyntenin-1-like [Daphnia pulex]
MAGWPTLVVVGVALALFAAVSNAETQVPRLDGAGRSVGGNSGYHGLVDEDKLIVDVTPKIRASGAEICAFRIVNKHHGETPFEIVVKDREKGEAELRAKKSLNCEKKKNYKFDIVAVSCAGISSENATVHISVNDVNEYAPKFNQPSYVVDVDEGRPVDKILQVEANDADCSAKYGDICRYDILNKDQPFAIDNEGVIRNTEPLDYEKNHNHILQVVAFDCGMKRSEPVLVSVKVNRVCRLGWTGISERVEYVPGSGRQDLFPEALINLCDFPCQPESIQARLTLASSHLGKNCDRDTYTIQNQRKLCGANSRAIDLLPPPGPGAEWTRDLPVDQGREADQVFVFDGATGVTVPPEVMSHNLTRNFTMSVWLKHDHHAGQDKHVKEHILCNADDHQMNRHHFSLFIRNCRLILLLRREFGDGDLKSFRPAEFRWKLPQVCDGQWHHYAVSMEFPEVQLYVDGRPMVASKNNPEIIDDWPLHNSHGLNTTLTVGACWQGSQSRMQHFMHGSMAGLSILAGQTELDEVIACFHKCKENLEAPPMELLQPGMEILNNNDLTELTLEGENKTNLEVLLRKVAYANLRDFPTPGRRPLRLYTNIICSSGRTLKIPVIESAIVVQATPLPIVTVTGLSSSHYGYESLRGGVHLFPDARIEVSNADAAAAADQDSSSEEDESSEEEDLLMNIAQRVDSCTATVYPPLNPDHETLTWPQNLLNQFKIEAKFSHDGVTLMGSESTNHYEQILHQLQYNNHKPAFYLTRAFKLICSQMSGRFASNELVHTVTVDHPQASSFIDGSTSTLVAASTTSAASSSSSAGHSTEPSTSAPQPPSQPMSMHQSKTAAPAHAKIDRHHVDIRPVGPITSISDVYMGMGGTVQGHLSNGASHTVTIIVMVCAGFLLLMISLGVVRVRAARRRAQQDETTADTEMAWDDSALTITVNPMETLEAAEKSTMTRTSLRHDDSDSEDDSCHGNDSSDEDPDDEDDDDDDDGGVCKARDLEWDNSTLSI